MRNPLNTGELDEEPDEEEVEEAVESIEDQMDERDYEEIDPEDYTKEEETETIEKLDSPVGETDSDLSECTRFEVCNNMVYGSTCPECWADIREQLEVDRCEKCENNRFKFLPNGEMVGLKCEDCGETTWQEVMYTGDQDNKDPRSVVA